MSGPLYSLQDLADEVDGEILGDPSIKIDSICTIQNASKGCISFLANPKYKRFLSSTKASAVIVNQENAKDLKCAGIIVKDPYTAYAVLSSMFISKKNPYSDIKTSCYIHKSSKVHDTAIIGSNVYILSLIHISEPTRPY